MASGADNLFGLDARYESNCLMTIPTNQTPLVSNGRVVTCVSNQSLVAACPITSEQKIEWILDSGASLHFTWNIDDFVEFQSIDKQPLKTANGQSQMEGVGTILLSIDETVVRVYPVYYVPDLTCRLLSLGQFLKTGLITVGNSEHITLLNEQDENIFLSFRPRSMNDNIYVIRSLIVNQEEQANGLETIYGVDFEVMHRRLAHPSKDVLRHANKHVKDFPEIEIPKEDCLCPGCLKGKMKSIPFQSSKTRAARPFELIHCDLKEFPTISYRKYKYAIVFYDDYSSHAWTMNLWSKDTAIHATKQFIKMVEVKHKSKIVQWMSDAGGEFKSNAFIKMLKDDGIEILQSIPHIHQQNGRAE